MSVINGIFAQVYVPAYFSHRGIDRTEGGVSGQHDGLIIVGVFDPHSPSVSPFPADITREISPAMGATVAIRYRAEFGREELAAHLVPVEWSTRWCRYVMDEAKRPYYRTGQNIAVLPEGDVLALRAATGIDCITAVLPIHDCTA